MIRVVFAFLVAISAYGQNPATASFPTSVATDAELLAAKDLSSSTLTSNINNSTTSVPVADGTQFIAAEVIRIDNEQMLIASIATNTLTVSRAYGGTSAASHLSGAAVRGIITSSHHNQLAAEIKTMQARLRDATGYCADAGSNDTYACSPAPCIASYSAGNRFWFKANTANTGAATVNFCSVGAKTIKKAVGGVTTDLADNDIRAGQFVEVIYDGTNMQMLSVLGNAAAAAAWGSITGTLSSQSDLQTALNAKLTTATGQAGTPTYCRSTTGNDTYTCTLTPTLTAYTRGGCLTLDADTANTLAASVNVDSLGAKSILNRAGSSLATGDITANKPITICYDGTQYIIQGDGGGSGSGDAMKSEVQSGGYLKCSVGSGGSPYTCTMTPTLTAYTDGMAVRFVRTGGTAETGTVTLNIDSLGATAIKKHGGTTDPGSFCNIPAGPVSIVLTYNSANNVFWLPPCPGDNNRGDAVSGTNLQYGAYIYCATGGTTTAYTCSLANSLSGGSAPALGAYANGGVFTVKLDATCGANPTINIDSLGAKKIYLKYSGGTATQPSAGDLVANRIYTFAYNSSLDSGSGGFEVNPGASDGTFTGTVTAPAFASSSTSAGEYKVFEASANGSDYVSFVAPDSITTIQRLKMAAAANTAGQTMQFGAPSSNISQASWATPLWTGQSNANGYFDWTLGAAPGNPASGDIRLYPKTGSTLCARTSAGSETCYGAGGASVTKVPIPVEIVTPPANVSGNFYSTGNCKAPTSTASGSNDMGAYSFSFPNTSTPTLECFLLIPGGWDGAAVSVKFVGGGNTPGSGSTVRFAIKTACVADGSAISSPTYGTATNLDLTGLSGGGNQKSATLSLTLDASCGSAAGKGMWVQIQRPNAGSDDWAANYHIVRLDAEFMVTLQ